MRNFLASIRDWYRPRKQHSLLDRWWRTAVITLPAWPIMHMFFPGPWYQGIGSVLGYSFLYALGDYAYFNVYGGTEKEYPNTPESDYWKRWFP
jgi:hypothetical protein